MTIRLGLRWIGVFDLKGGKDSAEERMKEVLDVPSNYRMISVLPIGMPKYIPEKSRKELSQLVYHEKFKA